MSRILRTESGTTRRGRILRSMAQALRAAVRSGESPADDVQDILAFLALALTELQESVDETTSAWERRAYWVKADRFRMEWQWLPRLRGRLEAALERGDLVGAGGHGLEIAAILADRKVNPGRGAMPWKGAWRAWREGK